MSFLKRAVSHIVPVAVAEYKSEISGLLDIRWEKGRLALNSANANYSFNALHKVMRRALKQTSISEKPSSRILNLGLGGGSTVQILREEMALANPIISVELDPVVVDIAKKFFAVERHEYHTIILNDAVKFVETCNDSFGLIVVDIFVDEKTPEPVRSEKFVKSIESLLIPHGQAIFNTMQAADGNQLMESINALGFEVENIRFRGQKNSVFLLSRG